MPSYTPGYDRVLKNLSSTMMTPHAELGASKGVVFPSDFVQALFLAAGS